MRRILIACTLAVASCGPSPTTEAPDVPAPVEVVPALADMSPRDALLDCAGAVTAESGVDPLAASPTTGSAAENTYFVILALMDKEPGLLGEAGRNAAAASRDTWLTRSAEARTARAAECASRWPG
jgi:hypothetical protein